MKINLQRGLFLSISLILLILIMPFVLGEVFINEIMYAPDTSLQGTDANLEWVELFNNGSAIVDLSSWQLEEKDFDDVNISPGEFIVIARQLTDSDADFSSFEAYYGNNDSVWNSSDGSYQAVDVNFSNALANTGEIVNLSNGTVTKFTVNYIQFATLNLAKQNGKTLIFYNGNFTESAFVNGTPGVSNDQFAPDFNKWINPSSNNSFIGGLFNVTVNITDIANVSSVFLNISTSNFSMQQDNDLWYFVLNTSEFTDGMFNLIVSFNDTSGFLDNETLFNISIDNKIPGISNPSTTSNSRNFVSPDSVFQTNVTATDLNLLNVTCTLSGTIVGFFDNSSNKYSCNLTAPSAENGFVITFTAIDKAGNTNLTTTNFTTKHTTSASIIPEDVTVSDLNNSNKIVKINAVFNNSGSNIIYEPGVRLTGLSSGFPGSILTDYAACSESNLTSGQSCNVNLSVNLNGASIGTFSAFFNANWTNANFSTQSLSQSVSSSIAITPNPLIGVTENVSIIVFHGTSKNITLHINSTGNVDLSDVNITLVPINLTQSEISFSPQNFAAVTSANETVNVTTSIAKATSPGTYRALFNVTANNTEFKVIKLIVEVPQDTAWTSLPSLTKTFKRSEKSGTAATIFINNSGNVDQNFSISYAGALFEFLMLSPVTVTKNLFVNKNSVGSFNIDHNSDGPLTIYNLTATITNQLTSEVNLSKVNLTQDNNNPNIAITNPINNSFVKGIVEFNVSASDLNLSGIEFYINNDLILNDTSIASAFNWNTSNGTYPDAAYTLKAIAFDSAGNSNSSIFNISVNNTDDAPIFLGNIPTITITEDNDSTTLNLSLFFRPKDGDTLKYNFTQPDNVTVNVNNATQIASFIPAANFFGTNFMIFTAIDSSLNTTSSNNVTITVTNVNDAPTTPALTSPANNSNVTSAIGKATLSWSVSVDVDNDDIIYFVFFSDNSTNIILNTTTSLTSLQLNNINANKTYFWNVLASDNSLNSSKSGTFQFFLVADNKPRIDSFVWNNTIVTGTNSTPFVDENKTLSFKVAASDPDKDTINFTWFVDNAEKSKVQNFTFDLTNNFTAAGSHTIKLLVQDNNSNSAEQQFQVTVTNVNRAPVLDTISNQNSVEDSTLKFNVTASDADGDTLTYTSNQSGLALTKINNTLAAGSFTPTNDNVGNNTISVTVSDGSLTGSQTFLITVSNTNDAPTIVLFSPTENKTIAENIGSHIFSLTASDVDAGDSLTISWFRNGTSIGSGSSVTVTGLAKGIYNITAIVTDNDGLTARNEWILTVSSQITSSQYSSPLLDLNSSQLESVTDVTINHSTFGSIDFGNNTLNFSGVTNLDNIVNISNGVIAVNTSSFPNLNKSASLVMKGLSFPKVPLIFFNEGFNVVSGGAVCNANSTPSCTNITYDKINGILRFNAEHFSTYFSGTNTTNGAPAITSTPVTSATEGSAYKYDVEADDPDGDTLAFSLITSPAGMGISSSSGVISWTPTASQLGTNNVTVNVSDGNLSDSQSFQINVSKGAKLVIKDLDVEVGGKKDSNVQNNTKINKEAEPGDSVEFKIELENRFTREEDLEIEDIQVQVTIEDIDDGDDLEEEASEFDLDRGDDKTVTISFDVPFLVKEDTFDVIIDVEGEDKNGTEHNIKWILELEVEKERHDLRIRKLNLNPTTVSCTRTATLSAEVANLGRDDEEEVTLEILNQELGISFRQSDIGLEEGDDDDATYDKTLSIRVTEEQEPGIYPITVNAYYDNDNLDDSKTVELTVQDCERLKEEREGVKGAQEPVEVIRPPVKVEEKSPVTEISFGQSDAYLILLATTFILLTGLTVFVVGAAIVVFRRR